MSADIPRIYPPTRLTPREIEVLDLIAQGFPLKEVASHLGIAHQTVKNYASNIYAKIGVLDKTQAALKVWGQGITDGLV